MITRYKNIFLLFIAALLVSGCANEQAPVNEDEILRSKLPSWFRLSGIILLRNNGQNIRWDRF
jgi:hypothetical protein